MVRTYSPKARVKIQLSNHGEQWLDVSDDLITLSTSKAYGRAAGGWEITLPRRSLVDFSGRSYQEIVTPDDLISIEIDAGDGFGFEFVMLGLVNRPARTMTFDADGRPRRTVKITGMDMGKLLARHDAGWNIALSDTNVGPPDMNRQAKVGFVFTGKALDVVEGIFKGLFLNDVTELAPLYTFAGNTDDTWEIYNYSINYMTGPVWNAMKQVANEPYNILHTDTLSSGTFQVALDKMPIQDNGKLMNIDHTIDEIDIITEDIGVCDDERVNYLLYKAHFSIIGADNRYPIWHLAPGLMNQDPMSVARHGASLVELETNFGTINMASTTTFGSEFLQDASKRGAALWNRMKNNHLLESGTLSMHVSPRIRAGAGLLHRGQNKEYLIEQVNHYMNFNQKPVATTTLAVTRGQEYSE